MTFLPVAVRGRADGARIEWGQPGQPAFTLRAPGGGSSLPHIAAALTSHAGRQRPNETWVTHPLTAEGADASEDGGGRGTPLVPIAATLTTGSGIRPAGRRRHDDTNLTGTAAGVRRLTPRECERLQGFPDDWTRWDATGAEQSDSARYRQLGNAVAAPVAEWIARRVTAVTVGLDDAHGAAA